MNIKSIIFFDVLKYRKELKMKVAKFKKMGYEEIDEKELLIYLRTYRWEKYPRWSVSRKKKDILEVQAWEFLDYQRLLALTSENKVNDLDNIQELF